MALMPGVSLKSKERSANARLIVSGIEQPAERFVLDPNLPVLFEYPFGFPGLTQVVIPKGLAVSVNGRQKDWSTGVNKPVLTVADGSNAYVGLAPYNLCKMPEDSLVGNLPTFVRQVYVELPYIKDPVDCSFVKYGAVHDRVAGNETHELQEGDYVVVSNDPSNKGHLTKYLSSDSPLKVVGQVIAIEDDAEPWGWFKWVMWSESAYREDKPEPNWALNAQPGEYTKQYRDGTLYQTGYQMPHTTKPTGLKGLTDGAYRGSVRVPFTVAAGATSTVVDVSNVADGAGLLRDGLVKVFIAGVELPSVQFNVDYNNQKVTITLPWAAPDDGLAGVIIAQHTALYGTPPGWDYVGAVGVVRIALL